jgi:hypothetical protein
MARIGGYGGGYALAGPNGGVRTGNFVHGLRSPEIHCER